MKTNNSVLILAVLAALAASGCGSTSTPEATAEQKKSFSGGPPPADYMSGVNAGAKAGEDAAKKAQQQHSN